VPGEPWKEAETAGYKPGAHCRLDYITEAEWERLSSETRARLAEVLSNRVIGRRLPDVVKQLWTVGEAELARELVHRLRRTESG